jgi:hypothetical protein
MGTKYKSTTIAVKLPPSPLCVSLCFSYSVLYLKLFSHFVIDSCATVKSSCMQVVE